MAEFKANNKKNSAPADESEDNALQHKSDKQAELAEEKTGWYEGSILFKRVIPIQGTSKFQYCDTTFAARCKANSPLHCYERIIQHLRNRQDIDLRSQFPSAKGKNFTYKYLGTTLPQ